jgi:hypothetical protein
VDGEQNGKVNSGAWIFDQVVSPFDGILRTGWNRMVDENELPVQSMEEISAKYFESRDYEA